MNGAGQEDTRRRGQLADALRLLCALALACVCGACAAASRNPDTGRPRAEEPPYVTLAADKDRRERALGAWATLAHDAGLAVPPPAPELQPVTATVRAIPPEAVNHLRLPLVEIKDAGKGAQPTKENRDEATRESLRRFITSARDLLGVSLDQLSLVEIRDEATARIAVYQQRPFRRPLRNGYGRVEIRFAPDRSVLAISSTAIPAEAGGIGRAIGQLRPREMTDDQVTARIKGRSFTYTNSSGASQTYTITASDTISVRELVIYPVAHAGNSDALDLHVAWESSVGGLSDVLVYVDAVTGEIIATTRVAASQASAGS
ncbi:MAG: hypothetical protein QOE33_1431 [Acidobacteriota bacterium]|nr:hypothetical protein [Acidobacteriota bacterium]